MDKEKLSLIEWLGYSKTPDFSKSRTLGGVIGGIIAIALIGVVVAVFISFIASLFGAGDSSDARNYALILAALLGVPFIIWRAFVAQKQVNIAEQGHMTDRISKAVEQLGAEKSTRDDDNKTQPNLEVRVGAIYALERISQDSKRDHISVMEILCAYVRNNAPDTDAVEIGVDIEDDNWRIKMRKEISAIKTAPIDIQTALSVISRRRDSHIAFERDDKNNPAKRVYDLDLRNTNLQKLDLTNAKLDNAKLTGARLTGANLSGAQLQGADFTAAHTRLAVVKSTALEGVKNLTEDQVKSMFGDSTTTLPAGIPAPDWANTELDWREFRNKWRAAKAAANL